MATLALAAALLLQSSRDVVRSPALLDPVAIVSALEGSASIKVKTGPQRPMALYDWLSPGAVVEVGAGSRAELILLDGQRYDLGGGARAELSATGVTTVRGPINRKPALPRLTLLAPIAGRVPREPSAVRLRAPGIAGLNPCDPIRTLHGATILKFEPVETAAQYVIEIQASDGRRVLSRTITHPPLAVEPGVLDSGGRYVWTVQVVGSDPPVRSERTFHTIDGDVEAARSALLRALDPADVGVIGGIDFNLGLLNEAAEELTAAAQGNPANGPAQAAAARARSQLSTACR